MKESDFRDYRRLLDEQAEQIFAITDDAGASAQDWRNTASQQAASPPKNLPLEMMTKLVVWMSGEACRTKVLFSPNYPLVQFFSVATATVPVFVDRDFDWRTATRGTHAND
jgi:hypothetical protein